MPSFGENLKKVRTEKGFSQGKLAERMQIDPSHISRYERDQTKPSLGVAVKFAQTLGVGLNQLAYGPNNEQIKEGVQDADLLNMFMELQHLKKDDVDTIKKMLGAFIFQKDIQQKLAS